MTGVGFGIISEVCDGRVAAVNDEDMEARARNFGYVSMRLGPNFSTKKMETQFY
jgi:hypothetical protein